MRLLRSERFAAALLLGAAVLGLAVANSPVGPAFLNALDRHLDIPWLGIDLSPGHWVSDGLLAIFFFIPIGIIKSITNQEITLNALAELFGFVLSI